jgi:hypothetical protein
MNSLIEFNVDHNPLEIPPTSVKTIKIFSNKKKKAFFFLLLGLYTWFTSYNAVSSYRSNERRKTTRFIN